MQKWMSTRDEKCFSCLCQHTGGCDLPPPCQRNSRGDIVCGYYHISNKVYQEAVDHTLSDGVSGSITTDWRTCAADRDCATNVIMEYAARTARRNCGEDEGTVLTCETIVRARSGECQSLTGEQLWLSKIKPCYES